jgi:RNA polymerase sigma-70 factor (ECF subfamily)
MPNSATSSLLQPVYRAALLRDGAGLSDGELLEGFIARHDGTYFEALVRRHGPMVLGVCRRILRDAHAADDAFQAAFLVLAQRAASIMPREGVGNWLYGVAYRTALAARKAAARRRARERQVSEMPQPKIEEETWLELLPVLDQELNRLPARYRVAVVLCHLEGRTRKDAAAQLGLPVGTLSGRLTTAMRLLAKRMSKNGLALSGAALAAALTPATTSACVPPSLVATTVRGTGLLAAGQPAVGLLSTEIAALAKDVSKSMLLAKLKVATAVILTFALVGAGASAFAYRTFTVGQTGDQPQVVVRENNKGPEKARQDDQPILDVPEASQKPVAEKSDKELLEGYWIPVGCMVDGKKISHDDPKLKKWRLIFKGDTVTLPGSQEVPYTLDLKKQPKEIDIEVNEPISPIKAIYEFEGKHLRLSWIKSGKRPTDFDTAKNESVLIVFKRGELP